MQWSIEDNQDSTSITRGSSTTPSTTTATITTTTTTIADTVTSNKGSHRRREKLENKRSTIGDYNDCRFCSSCRHNHHYCRHQADTTSPPALLLLLLSMHPTPPPPPCPLLSLPPQLGTLHHQQTFSKESLCRHCIQTLIPPATEYF